MKKPFSERFISDFFVGVFPKEEINRMMDESNARSLEVLEKYGDDVSWEIYFLMKIMKKQQDLQEAIDERQRQS